MGDTSDDYECRLDLDWLSQKEIVASTVRRAVAGVVPPAEMLYRSFYLPVSFASAKVVLEDFWRFIIQVTTVSG